MGLLERSHSATRSRVAGTEVKRKRPDLPVILLTGHGSVASVKAGMKEGAFDYLMKPIDIDELIEKIGDAVGREKGQ